MAIKFGKPRYRLIHNAASFSVLYKPRNRSTTKLRNFTCYYFDVKGEHGWSQWPRGLRHELPSLARTLGSWARIPLKAWMFGVCMRLFCVCVVLCLGISLARGWSLVQEVLPSVKKLLRNWIRGPGSEWVGRAIERKGRTQTEDVWGQRGLENTWIWGRNCNRRAKRITLRASQF
jgi:hypothetical protein